MSTSIQVPQDYLTLARSYGLSKSTAVQIYATKANFKAINTASVQELMRLFGTETRANRTVNTLWKNYNSSQFDNFISETPVPPKVVPKEKQEYGTYLEEARKALEATVGKLNKVSFNSDKKLDQDRIAVAGDIHGLFVNDRAFSLFLKDPAPTAIIMGDLTDFYSLSGHKKALDYITAREEIADARAKAEVICKHFKKVYFLSGNHDGMRARKQLQQHFPNLLPLLVDPMDLFFSGLDNSQKLTLPVKKVRNSSKFADNFEMDSCAMFNDVYLSHMENFCGADAPMQVDKWVMDWSHILEVTPRVVMHAHTHRLSSTITATGKQLVNTGCLCNPMPYQFEHHGKYSPPVVGWAAIYQKNGITDINKTELVYIGS